MTTKFAMVAITLFVATTAVAKVVPAMAAVSTANSLSTLGRVNTVERKPTCWRTNRTTRQKFRIC